MTKYLIPAVLGLISSIALAASGWSYVQVADMATIKAQIPEIKSAQEVEAAHAKEWRDAQLKQQEAMREDIRMMIQQQTQILQRLP